MADNAKIIWDSLIKNGFTEVATAGIMGNLMAESHFNPKIVQGGGEADNITCDGETGYGIAQWTSINRQEGLASLAASKGRPSGDLMVQIDWLIQEIDQYDVRDIMNQQTSPYQAALLFHKEFERSADTEEQAARRGHYAEEIYSKKGVDCSNLSYDGSSSTYGFGSVMSGILGMAASVFSAPKVAGRMPHGKHTDTIFKNPSKTYCEPVYPDLVSINTKIPDTLVQDVLDKCDTSELIQGANLVYTAPVSTLNKYGAADYVNAQATNALAEQQRKESFNAKKHAKAIKSPSSGKPPNNEEPFPIDAKIKELETHQPRCKIEKIRTCPEAINVTKACMQLSTNVEKRIVKLENNMATILRYLGRMSSRASINCVYWGGTNVSEKYLAIRCMRDDRIQDGQYVSMDQCLTCTRFEPLIGQVYDILNDSGINLAQVLDDCQMSYTTPEEYCKFVKSTEHQATLTTKTLDFASVNNRNANEKDFKEDWGEGIKMNWHLYPVEDQKPHINKAQNINGEEFSDLASAQGLASNGGSMYTASGSSNRMVYNKGLMDDVAKKG